MRKDNESKFNIFLSDIRESEVCIDYYQKYREIIEDVKKYVHNEGFLEGVEFTIDYFSLILDFHKLPQNTILSFMESIKKRILETHQ